MEKFIYEYFVEPILSRTGYNVVNTFVYAIIAIASVYALFVLFKTKGVRVDKNFILSALCFVLLGSTVRVVTDSIDSGVFAPITPIHSLVLQSHIYDYGFLTVTPGIYVVIAAVFLLSVFIARMFGRLGDLWKIGLALWLPHFLLILPFAKYFSFAFLAILLAAVPWFAARFLLKDEIARLVVGAHALDGAATFVAIDIAPKFAPLAYFEQHVFSRLVGIAGGSYLAFYLLKILISFAAAWVVLKENMEEEEKNYIFLVLIIMGLAPGLRDLFRLAIGA
jgi:uncharacterized membrane protein